MHNRREGKRIIYRCKVGLFTEWHGKRGRELVRARALLPRSSRTARRDQDSLLCPIVSKALTLYKVVLRLPRALLEISPLHVVFSVKRILLALAVVQNALHFVSDGVFKVIKDKLQLRRGIVAAKEGTSTGRGAHRPHGQCMQPLSTVLRNGQRVCHL